MTSKIINMAEKIKDAEDQLLESMFALEPIADSGFSQGVVRRIRRQLWLRRLALPIALCIGAAIAMKPALQLTLAVSRLLAVMPQNIFVVPMSWLPQLQFVVIGALLLVAGVLGIRLLED